jgi:hypothetical protein
MVGLMEMKMVVMKDDRKVVTLVSQMVALKVVMME